MFLVLEGILIKSGHKIGAETDIIHNNHQILI
jgi:hypothetical protein